MMSRLIRRLPWSKTVASAWGSTLFRVAGFAFVALLAQGFLWSAEAPAVIKAGVVGLGLLAAVRPTVSLLVLAAVVPFGRVISREIFQIPSARFTEALALAFVAGWLWTRLRRPSRDERLSPGTVFAFLFARVVVASVVVELVVLRYWKDYWWPYLQMLAVYFGRDYLLISVGERPWLENVSGLLGPRVASLFLVGLALMRAVQLFCRRDAPFGRRLALVSVTAAVGAAALSVWMAMVQATSAGLNPLAFGALDRLAVITQKVGTAASFFVLFTPIAASLWWLTDVRVRPRPAWVPGVRRAAIAAGLMLLSTALWLTGSRTPLVAGAAVAGAAFLMARIKTPRIGTLRWPRVAIVALCGALLALLSVTFYQYVRHVTNEESNALYSLRVRLAMWEASVRMLAEHPLAGIGLGRFASEVGAFQADEAVRGEYPTNRFDAHNQFLQMAVEVGAPGGALFLAMFLTILGPAWAAFRKSRDALLAGVFVGLAAFLMTCLSGQPLFVEVVAYPFWMVLGIALAAGDDVAAATSPAPDRGRLWQTRLTASFLVALAVSVPVRVWMGQQWVNYALVRYGFSKVYDTADQQSYRVVKNDATFFTYFHARFLQLPIRRDVQAGRNALEVDVSLDGRLARRLTLKDDEWQTVAFLIPAEASRRARRIDLKVRAPRGVPAVVRVGQADVKKDERLEHPGSH